MLRMRRRHSWTFDLSGITDPAHRDVVQSALNACSYPFGRIRRNTGRKVPVAVSDLSRFAVALDAQGHGHVHSEAGEHGHLLGAPEARKAPLGLYWLPTTQHPAGRIELHSGIMGDTALAQEVFLAEAAHAVDYGVPLTDEQRLQIAQAYHDSNPHDHSPSNPHGWFEEKGERDYFDWIGESFMSGFMAAYAPKLPRPLEQRQPWAHKTTPEVVRVIRKVLRRRR